jgi:hypothetical protein
VRTGRDGRRRPVNPVPGQIAIARVMADNPMITNREAARVAGVAPSTVHRVVAGLIKSKVSSPVAATADALVTPGTADGLADAAAFQSSQEYAHALSWLAITAVTIEDLSAHLSNLPLSRTYEIVDECRRRARVWGEIAGSLEARMRRRCPVTM